MIGFQTLRRVFLRLYTENITFLEQYSNKCINNFAANAFFETERLINSNLMPGTVLFNSGSQGTHVQNQLTSASVSYTFTDDYSKVLVFATGGVVYWNSATASPTNSDVGISFGGNGSVTCTNGTIENKNGFYLIKNVKKNATVTISYSGVVNGFDNKVFVKGIILV